MPAALATARPRTPWSRTFKNYLALTKPRVIELLLLVTLPTMILAQGSWPNFWLVLAVLVGGALSAGAAGAFNCYIDRETDKKMQRTRSRPLATGEISERAGLIFAWSLAVGSTIWFAVFTNLLATALSVGAIFFYAVVYSLILKKRTPQNIVWGGLAGCAPVLIGWAAVTNSIEWPAVVLFAIIFLWTPPHYWPLSMRHGQDYRKAGIPMLGAISAGSAVGLQVVLYAVATLACSLLLIPVANMGLLYAVVALAGGGYFVYETYGLYVRALRKEPARPMRVFHASILYLTVLFVAVGIDPFLHLAIL